MLFPAQVDGFTGPKEINRILNVSIGCPYGKFNSFLLKMYLQVLSRLPSRISLIIQVFGFLIDGQSLLLTRCEHHFIVCIMVMSPKCEKWIILLPSRQVTVVLDQVLTHFPAFLGPSVFPIPGTVADRFWQRH